MPVGVAPFVQRRTALQWTLPRNCVDAAVATAAGSHPSPHALGDLALEVALRAILPCAGTAAPLSPAIPPSCAGLIVSTRPTEGGVSCRVAAGPPAAGAAEDVGVVVAQCAAALQAAVDAGEVPVGALAAAAERLRREKRRGPPERPSHGTLAWLCPLLVQQRGRQAGAGACFVV